jgi:hypothetical protein
MTYFKDDEGNFYIQYSGPSPKHIRAMKEMKKAFEEAMGTCPYLSFLKKVGREEEDYHEYIFIGGKIIHNKTVTLHLDLTVNCDRLRLDLILGDGKKFCERFPSLGALQGYVTYMISFLHNSNKRIY